jgi:ATP-binding cassette subfamily B protein/ATP-binding cassette subfamily C protein/ATP-binding cassette subfamily B multidrug efflux pump
LFSAASPEKLQVRKGLLLLLIAAGLEAIGPWLGKAFIDQYLLPRQLAWTAIIPLLAAFLVSGWIATWLRYRQLVRLAGVAMRSVQRLREQVYSHVLKLPMAFFDRSMTGQLVSRVTNDTEAVKNLYVQVLFVMLDSSIVVIGAMTGMLLLEWRLFLVVLPLIPAVVLIVWFYQRWSAPAVARARQLRSDINAQLAESLQGMHTLQASRAEQRFAQRFDQTGQQHYAARLQELKANAWLLRPALDFSEYSDFSNRDFQLQPAAFFRCGNRYSVCVCQLYRACRGTADSDHYAVRTNSASHCVCCPREYAITGTCSGRKSESCTDAERQHPHP